MTPDLTFGPDVNADLLPLLDRSQWPESFARCSGLQLYSQQIGADTENQYHVGQNFYPRLRQAEFFRRIGLPLTLEASGPKEWSTSGVAAAESLAANIARVEATGGRIVRFTLDEPLASANRKACKFLTVEDAVEPTRRVLAAGRAKGVGDGGLVQPYPDCSVADTVTLCERVSPSHLHLDVDVAAFTDRRMSETQIAEELQMLSVRCKAPGWGLAFRVILHGQRGNTPQTYHDATMRWLTDAMRYFGAHQPDGWIVQSWKASDPNTRQPNGLPENLPEVGQYSHTRLLLDVARRLEANG
jgi:hypothetical protein